MKDLSLISVIIPAYNVETFLVQCLENLLFQSYHNLEVIVIDDGSTDNTADLARRFTDVKYLYQNNQGVSVARNAGIDAASGEYIHFMDADDLVNLDFYEKMAEAAIAADADMACCGFEFERFPSQSQKIEHTLLVSTTEDKILHTNIASYGACWRYIFKTSFLKKNKLYFEAGRISAEDRMFSLQAVYYANRIVLVPDAVYYYKNRKNSVTVSKSTEIVRKRHEDRRYANKFMENFAQNHGFELGNKMQSKEIQFALLGLPLISKKIFHPGKIKWYFLGIPLFQKREKNR